MKITLNADALAGALKHGIAATNTNIAPVLQHVRITMDGANAVLESTDLETWVQARVAATGDDSFDILLRDDLLRAAAAPGSGEVTIGEDGFVRTGRGKYTIPALPSADFPSAEDVDWVDVAVDTATLRDALRVVGYAGDEQDARPFCRAVQLVPGLVWATDGRSLAAIAIDYDGPICSIPVGQVQRVVEALSQDEPVRLQVVLGSAGSARLLRVEGAALSVSMRLLDAAPMDMRANLAGIDPGTVSVRLHAAQLQGALRRMLPFARFAGGGKARKTGFDQVRLCASGDGLVLQDRSGEFREDVSAAIEEGASAGEWEIAFDCRRMTAALAASGAEGVTLYPRSSFSGSIALVPHGLTLQQATHLLAPITTH